MSENVKIALISAVVAIVTASITAFSSVNSKKGEVAAATQKLNDAAVVAKSINADISTTLIPVGMIASFNLASCPSGWADFEQGYGRTIVGVGQGAGLSPRMLLEMGGAEKHALSPDEAPIHKHTTSEAGDATNSKHGIEHGRGKHGQSWADTTVSLTGPAGGGQPHANMQPFVALRLCAKR